MDLMKDISAERLPVSREGSVILNVVESDSDLKHVIHKMTKEEVYEKIEMILLERIRTGDKLSIFQLAQLHFEEGNYEKALPYYERLKEQDPQAMFQLGVMYYDGLGCETNHKVGFDYMMKVATSNSKHAKHLVRAAQYNIGRAYFQGYGIKRQSDEEAEKWLLLAADDGNPKASVKAQSTLGLYYSCEDTRDLKKAFFWHSEACGNGNLESQGAMGIMYLHGLGTKKDINSAFICLRESAERGNVYSMGHLASYYYQRKLYTKTVELAARVSTFTDINQIAAETDCLPSFVAKGIAMCCFYYARCLHQGHGVKKDEAKAKEFYSKSYTFDADICAKLQAITQKGEI